MAKTSQDTPNIVPRRRKLTHGAERKGGSVENGGIDKEDKQLQRAILLNAPQQVRRGREGTHERSR